MVAFPLSFVSFRVFFITSDLHDDLHHHDDRPKSKGDYRRMAWVQRDCEFEREGFGQNDQRMLFGILESHQSQHPNGSDGSWGDFCFVSERFRGMTF